MRDQSEDCLPTCAVGEHWIDTTVVVQCSGVLDMLTSPTLEQHIDDVLDKQPKAVIVDLSSVEFLASRGMNVLVSTCNEINGDIGFAVVAEGPATSRPMMLMGLDAIFPIVATVDQALAALTSPDQQPPG